MKVSRAPPTASVACGLNRCSPAMSTHAASLGSTVQTTRSPAEREEQRIVALSLALSLVITLSAWFAAMTAA